MSVTKLWNCIINLGNSNSYDLSEQARIRLVNKLGAVAFIGSFGLTVVRYFTDPATIYGSYISFFFIAIILFLNFRRFHTTSRIIACFLFPVGIMYIIMMDGATMGEFVIYLLNVVLTYILFEERRVIRNAAIIWISSIAIFSFYYITITFEENPIASHPIGTICLFFTAIILLCYMISFYQLELKLHRKQKDQLLSNLKEKNIELERFVHISSHDLKEPAKTIIAFSELSASFLKQHKYDKVDEFIQVINSCGRRMNQLIEDTLEFTSYENSQEELDLVNLETVLKEAKKLLSKSISEKSASIVSYQNLPSVLGKEKQLISCFANLIENGITYNIEKDPIVEIDCKLDDGQYTITFRDNGVGIKEEYHEKIFQMYERLVNRHKIDGTGLGLPISKKVIERLGGSIWVTSQEGVGSTFYIILPAVSSSSSVTNEMQVQKM